MLTCRKGLYANVTWRQGRKANACMDRPKCWRKYQISQLARYAIILLQDFTAGRIGRRDEVQYSDVGWYENLCVEEI